MSKSNAARTRQSHPKVVPERYTGVGHKCQLEVNGCRYDVINYSAFGLAIEANKSNTAFLGSATFEAFFYVGSAEAQDITLRFVRSEELEGGKLKVAFEVRGEPIQIQKINAIIECFEATKTIHEQLETTSEIDPAFRLVVQEVEDVLATFKHTLEGMEAKWGQMPPDIRRDREAGTATVVATQMHELLSPRYEVLDAMVKKLPLEERGGYLKYFRQKIFDFIAAAPIVNRCYFKPLGYAGDYEMMNQIYRDDTEGNSLFEKCVHKYYIDQSAAQAVKNRSEYLHDHISWAHSKQHKNSEDRTRILSLASGPAFELQRYLKLCPTHMPSVEFTLIDQDLRALQHAQYRVREMCIKRNLNFFDAVYLHNSIKNIIASGLETATTYDLIYSAGLFDYLSDAVAVACMKQLYANLKPGGRLVIGNFDISNPSRVHMELALDWFLIYRTREDMMRLGKQVMDTPTVEAEAAGVNLFLVMEKK